MTVLPRFDDLRPFGNAWALRMGLKTPCYVRAKAALDLHPAGDDARLTARPREYGGHAPRPRLGLAASSGRVSQGPRPPPDGLCAHLR